MGNKQSSNTNDDNPPPPYQSLDKEPQKAHEIPQKAHEVLFISMHNTRNIISLVTIDNLKNHNVTYIIEYNEDDPLDKIRIKEVCCAQNGNSSSPFNNNIPFFVSNTYKNVTIKHSKSDSTYYRRFK